MADDSKCSMGIEFPSLPAGLFVDLRADASGNLWLRGDHQQVVVGRNGQFRKLGVTDGLPPSGARSLESGADGTIWIGDDKGRLLKWDMGHFAVVKESPPTEGWGSLHNLQVDAAGAVLTWTDRRVARLTGGQWSIIFEDEDGGGIAAVRALRDGSVVCVAGRHKDRLVRYSNGKLTDVTRIPGGFYGYFLAEDPTGDLWISKQDGVLRLEPDGRWTKLTRADGLPADTVRSELLDREGNRWFGTDGGGLVRLKRRAVRAFGLAEGMSKKIALSVAADGTNSAWVAVLQGGLNHFDGDRFSPVLLAPWLGSGSLVWCVTPAPGGGVWFANYADGLFLLDASQTHLERFSSDTRPGLISGPIMTLFSASHGDLWIGGERGLSRYSGSQFRSWTAADGLTDNHVNAIAEDRSGAIWIGTDSGLNRMTGDKITKFTMSDGLPANLVRSVFFDSQGSLWIGGRELARYKDGKFSFIRAVNGLPVTTIKAIIEDDLGYLWLSTPHGILRASRRQLNEVSDTGNGKVEFSVFTKADGVPSNECSGYEPAVWKGGDGRLWFATLNGLAIIDPHHLPKNAVPPPVAVEAVVADDKALALPRMGADAASDSDRVWIPAGTLRLEFRFAAMSYTAPEKNQFRYRLEGFDGAWVQAGLSQTASYTRPPPGSYHFHVCACNNDGVWNESGATLALTVLPFFWQTKWFQALVVAAALGLIYWVFRTRLALVERRRLVQESFARQVIETQEAERQRIAQRAPRWRGSDPAPGQEPPFSRPQEDGTICPHHGTSRSSFGGTVAGHRGSAGHRPRAASGGVGPTRLGQGFGIHARPNRRHYLNAILVRA